MDFGRIIDVEEEEVQREFRLYSSLLNRDKNQVLKELKDRNFTEDPQNFDFDEFWRILQAQEKHYLTDGAFRITRSSRITPDLSKYIFQFVH